jgi:hypothetical protein
MTARREAQLHPCGRSWFAAIAEGLRLYYGVSFHYLYSGQRREIKKSNGSAPEESIPYLANSLQMRVLRRSSLQTGCIRTREEIRGRRELLQRRVVPLGFPEDGVIRLGVLSDGVSVSSFQIQALAESRGPAEK